MISLRLSESEQQVLAKLADGSTSSAALRDALHRVGARPHTARVRRSLEAWEKRIRAGYKLGDREVFLTKAEIADVLTEWEDPRWAWGDILPPMLGVLRETMKQQGFFFPPVLYTAGEALHELRSGTRRPAADYLRSVFPSFWYVNDGPAGWGASHPRWRKLLMEYAGLNSRKELYDVSLARLRKGLRVQRYVVSFFQPAQAQTYYERFLGGARQPRVWDPSCGFGARLLGFFAAFPGGTYCGNDPSSRTFADLFRLANLMPGRTELFESGSETETVPEGPFDLVFTSPPYFDAEKYTDEPTQSYVKFPTLDSWEEGFVRPTLAHAVDCLKPGGPAIFNVNDTLVHIYLRQADRVGLKLEGQERMPVKTHHFNKTGVEGEPLLIFRKPK